MEISKQQPNKIRKTELNKASFGRSFSAFVKRLRYWFFRQAMKDISLREKIERDIRNESIAYNLWVGSLHKSGFPKHENRSWMDCWDLWDYYSRHKSREIYVRHADSK